MDTYRSYKDLNRLSKRQMEALGTKQPEFLENFKTWRRSVIKDGALSVKHKELIAAAVATYAQCERCVGLHVDAARRAGATDEEIREAMEVVTVMGAGIMLMSTLDTLEGLEEL